MLSRHHSTPAPESLAFAVGRRPAASPLAAIRAAWTHRVDPVFLIGCPESGAGRLQRLLAAHPEIHTGPETHFFQIYAPVMEGFVKARERPGLSDRLTRHAFRGMMAQSFWSVVSALPEPRIRPRYFLEQSPHHCRCAHFIHAIFPNARFLHLIRDGRGAVAAMLRSSRSPGNSWMPKTAGEATALWVESISAARAVGRLTAGPHQYLEVRHEALRSRPREELGRILSWLGLPALRFDGAGPRRPTAAVGGLVEDPFGADLPAPGSAPGELFGSDEADLPLAESHRELIERLAGDMLRQLGYLQ